MTTQQQLQALLARNEFEELTAEMRLICLQAPNDQHGNDLVLLVSQYNTFLENEAKLYAADRDVALAKIKDSFQDLIELLDIPKGDATEAEWIKKQQKNAVEQIVQSPWRWSVLIALFSLLLLGIGQLRVQKTDFELKARVKKIGLRPAQDWSIGAGYDLFLSRFELENAAATPTLPAWQVNNAFVSLQGGRIQLNALPLGAGQAFTLEADKQECILQLASGSTHIQLDLLGTQVSFPDAGLDTLLGETETGDESLHLESSLAPKIWLSAHDSLPLVLPALQVDSIDFYYKAAINAEEKADSSGLLSGSIQVDQGIHQLSKGGGLSLGGLQNAILEIKPQNGGFDLVLRGKAGHLRTAYLGQKSNLMPTWLQYFRQNQAFLFYFSSLCALFTVLFPLRNWFVQSKK
jgi:hypothetical protein